MGEPRAEPLDRSLLSFTVNLMKYSVESYSKIMYIDI